MSETDNRLQYLEARKAKAQQDYHKAEQAEDYAAMALAIRALDYCDRELRRVAREE